MKLLYKILFSLFIFNLSYSQISSDCSTAVPICGNITSGGNVNGLGVDDFNGAGNSGCLFSGGGGVTTVESNSAWYTFTVQNSGQFGFNIDPNVNSEDWDYALYGPFATNSGNCGLNLGNPVKCNYSGSTSNQGFTGVGVNPVTTTQTVQYDSWLNVSAGETYILLINNYSATNNGFSLSFSGSIFNTYPNTLDCSVVCGISLGPDQRYCSTTTNSHVLTANFNLAPTTPGTPTYSWFLEGVLQTTTTTNTLVITQNGNWSVEVVRPGCSDVATDTVLITFDAPPTLNTPVSPIDIGCGPFDLTTLIPALVSPELPADFVVYFYEDFVDCLDGNANFIPTPTAYTPTAPIDVYIRVENLGNPTCFNFDMVSLVYNCSALNASVSANTICSGNTGTVTFTGTPNALVNYTVDGVLAPAITLDATGQFILTTSVLTANSVYTLVDVSDGTTTTPLTASATVSVIALPTASISGTTDICFGSSTNLTFTGTADAIVTYTDGTSNFTTTLVGGTSTVSVSPTTTTTYSLVSVATNTTPVCTATPPGSAVVTVSQQVSGSLSYTPSDFCTIDFGTYAPTVVISGAGTGTCASTTPEYTATPAGLTIDAITGVITPSTSSVGTYIIRLRYPACGGCGVADLTTTVTVSSPGSATLSYTTPLCANDAATYAPTLLGAASATNFTATPAGLAIDLITGVISPSGSTAGTYTINYSPASVGACVITGTPTTVTITAAPTASISGTTDICFGSSTNLTFTGTADSVVTYTDGTSNFTTTLIGGTSTETVSPTNTTTYSLVSVTSSTTPFCTATPVGITTVTVIGLPIASISGTTDICFGSSTNLTFTGTADAIVTYTDGTSNFTTTLIGGTSTETVSPTGTTTYSLVSVATNTTPICSATPVGSTTVTVIALPTASISGTTDICSGSSTNLTFTGTADAVVTYTDGTSNFTTTLIGGTSTETVSPTGTTTYSLVSVTSSTTPFCTATPVGSATVTVIALPTASISGTTDICFGSSTNLTFTGTADSVVTYTDGTSNFTTTLIGGTSTETVSPTNTTTYSLVSVTSSTTPFCTATPVGITTVTVIGLPIASISGTTDICFGSSTNLTFTGTADAVVTYTDGTSNFTTTLIGGTSTETVSPTGTTTYSLVSVATNTTPICSATPVGSTTVTVIALPTASISGTTDICSGSSTNLTFTGTADAVVTYTDGTSNFTTTLIGGTSTETVSPTGTTTYSLVSVTSSTTPFCTATPVGSATFTVIALPTASISGTTDICFGSSTNLTFTGTADSVVTYTDGTSNFTTTLIGGTSTETVSPTNTTTYSLVSVTSSTTPFCTATPVGITTVTVIGLPIASISGTTDICFGSSTNLTFTGTADAVVTYTDGTSNFTTTLIGGTSTETVSPIGTTTYSLVSVATNTTPICSATPVGSATVTVIALPTASISGTTDICFGSSTNLTFTGTAAAVVTYTDGTSNFTTTLIGGTSTETVSPTGTTTYSLVSVTSSTTPFCTATPVGGTTVTVIALPQIVLTSNTITTSQVKCVNTALDNITYMFSGGATGVNVVGLPAGVTASTTGNVVTISGTPTAATAATYNYTITAIGSTCGTPSLSGSITLTSGIVPIFDPVSAVCEGVSPNLPPTSNNGIIGVWQLLSSTANDATYEFTPDAGQCALKTQMIVQINPLPEVIWTVTPASRSICSGDTVTIQLRSNVPGATFSWTSNSPTVSGHSSSVLGSTATVISQPLTLNSGVTTTGEVTYAIVAEANGCAGATTFVTISVNPIPDVIVNGNNPLSLCSGNTTAISFSSSVSNTVYNWTVQSSTGVSGAFNGSGSSIAQQLQTTGLSTGVVVYEVTPSFNGCTGTPKQVTVNVNPIPQLFGSTTQPAVCSGLQPTVISLSSPDPATVYTWIVNQVGVSGAEAGTSTGQNLSIVQLLTTTDVDVAGYVDYIITPSLNGCPGASVTIRVNVNPIPQVSIEDGVICVDAVGDTFQTHLIETGLDESVYDFVWYINNVPQANSNSANFIASVVGTYGVQVTNPLTNCSSVVAQANITSTTPATTLSTTVSNAFTDNATIVVTATGGDGTLLYQLDQGAYQESNVFTGVSGGAHEVTVIDSDGCTFLRENVMIIDYPKYFTPNGDGIHDTWNISGLNQVDAKLFIFDRYGKLIKQLIPVDGEMGWDGTYNQELLPSTDYWFTLDYIENGATKQFKAHFSMKR